MARWDLHVAFLHGIAENQMLPLSSKMSIDRIAMLNYPQPEKASTILRLTGSPLFFNN
jgi:hypothetical protein